MAKTIKFNLICDGNPVRTLEDLIDNFVIEDVVEYFNNKLLQRWLSVRGYEETLEKVEGIKTTDTLEVVKELVEIFQVDDDPVSIEENTYIFQYNKERQLLMEEYEKKGFKVTSIINNYHSGYIQLVNCIIENKDNIAQIKAAVKEINDKYPVLFELSYRELFFTLLENAPLAIFVMIMNENMRKKYLPLSTTIEDENLAANCVLSVFGSSDNEQSICSADKQIMYESICALIKDEKSLTEMLGENLKIFAGATNAYWKDVETKNKKYMILNMKNGNYVRNAGLSGGDLNSLDTNGKFVILDGIDYKSNSDSDRLLYMEV